jgi:hypothetical protein
LTLSRSAHHLLVHELIDWTWVLLDLLLDIGIELSTLLRGWSCKHALARQPLLF